eukprot:tig00000042_g15557.t1
MRALLLQLAHLAALAALLLAGALRQNIISLVYLILFFLGTFFPRCRTFKAVFAGSSYRSEPSTLTSVFWATAALFSTAVLVMHILAVIVVSTVGTFDAGPWSDFVAAVGFPELFHQWSDAYARALLPDVAVVFTSAAFFAIVHHPRSRGLDEALSLFPSLHTREGDWRETGAGAIGAVMLFVAGASTQCLAGAPYLLLSFVRLFRWARGESLWLASAALWPSLVAPYAFVHFLAMYVFLLPRVPAALGGEGGVAAGVLGAGPLSEGRIGAMLALGALFCACVVLREIGRDDLYEFEGDAPVDVDAILRMQSSDGSESESEAPVPGAGARIVAPGGGGRALSFSVPSPSPPPSSTAPTPSPYPAASPPPPPPLLPPAVRLSAPMGPSPLAGDEGGSASPRPLEGEGGPPPASDAAPPYDLTSEAEAVAERRRRWNWRWLLSRHRVLAVAAVLAWSLAYPGVLAFPLLLAGLWGIAFPLRRGVVGACLLFALGLTAATYAVNLPFPSTGEFLPGRRVGLLFQPARAVVAVLGQGALALAVAAAYRAAAPAVGPSALLEEEDEDEDEDEEEEVGGDVERMSIPRRRSGLASDAEGPGGSWQERMYGALRGAVRRTLRLAYLLSVAVLYVGALSSNDLLHAAYLLFCVAFVSSPALARRFWHLVVLYAAAACAVVYLYAALAGWAWDEARVPLLLRDLLGLTEAGARFYESVLPHVAIAVATGAQLHVYRSRAYREAARAARAAAGDLSTAGARGPRPAPAPTTAPTPPAPAPAPASAPPPPPPPRRRRLRRRLIPPAANLLSSWRLLEMWLPALAARASFLPGYAAAVLLLLIEPASILLLGYLLLLSVLLLHHPLQDARRGSYARAWAVTLVYSSLVLFARYGFQFPSAQAALSGLAPPSPEVGLQSYDPRRLMLSLLPSFLVCALAALHLRAYDPARSLAVAEEAGLLLQPSPGLFLWLVDALQFLRRAAVLHARKLLALSLGLVAIQHACLLGALFAVGLVWHLCGPRRPSFALHPILFSQACALARYAYMIRGLREAAGSGSHAGLAAWFGLDASLSVPSAIGLLLLVGLAGAFRRAARAWAAAMPGDPSEPCPLFVVPPRSPAQSPAPLPSAAALEPPPAAASAPGAISVSPAPRPWVPPAEGARAAFSRWWRPWVSAFYRRYGVGCVRLGLLLVAFVRLNAVSVLYLLWMALLLRAARGAAARAWPALLASTAFLCLAQYGSVLGPPPSTGAVWPPSELEARWARWLALSFPLPLLSADLFLLFLLSRQQAVFAREANRTPRRALGSGPILPPPYEADGDVEVSDGESTAAGGGAASPRTALALSAPAAELSWHKRLAYGTAAPTGILFLVLIVGTSQYTLLKLGYLGFALILLRKRAELLDRRSSMWTWLRGYNLLVLALQLVYQAPFGFFGKAEYPWSWQNVIGLWKMAPGAVDGGLPSRGYAFGPTKDGSVLADVAIFALASLQAHLFSHKREVDAVVAFLRRDEAAARARAAREEEFVKEERLRRLRVPILFPFTAALVAAAAAVSAQASSHTPTSPQAGPASDGAAPLPAPAPLDAAAAPAAAPPNPFEDPPPSRRGSQDAPPPTPTPTPASASASAALAELSRRGSVSAEVSEFIRPPARDEDEEEEGVGLPGRPSPSAGARFFLALDALLSLLLEGLRILAMRHVDSTQEARYLLRSASSARPPQPSPAPAVPSESPGPTPAPTPAPGATGPSALRQQQRLSVQQHPAAPSPAPPPAPTTTTTSSSVGALTAGEAARQAWGTASRYPRAVYRILWRHTGILAMTLAVIAHAASGSLLSVVYPLAVLGYALMQAPRPGRAFWGSMLAYTEALICLPLWCPQDPNTLPFTRLQPDCSNMTPSSYDTITRYPRVTLQGALGISKIPPHLLFVEGVAWDLVLLLALHLHVAMLVRKVRCVKELLKLEIDAFY